MTPEITPTDATLGAVVSNVRLNALDDEAFAAIEEAWHAHAVLIFPDQHLSEEEQVDFSQRFGPLERSLTKTHTQGDPAIIHLSNVKKDGTLWGADSDTGRLLKGNNYWHTDSSYKRIPAKASLLTAKIVPKTGARPPSPTCARPTTPSMPPCGTGSRTTRSPCTATPTARARSAAWAASPRTSGTRCRRWSSP